MPRVTQRLRVGLTTIVLLVILTFMPLAAAATVTSPELIITDEPTVIITELQLAGDTASQEFIELYNTTDSDISFQNEADSEAATWKLLFYASTSVSSGAPNWNKPTATVSLSGVIPAKSYFLVAATSYKPGGIDGDQQYSPRMASTGGGLQLIEVSKDAVAAHDRMMWMKQPSTKNLPEGVLFAPANAESLQRVPSTEGEYLSEDSDAVEYVISNLLSPKDSWQPEVIENPEDSENTDDPDEELVDVPAEEPDPTLEVTPDPTDPVEPPAEAVTVTNEGLQPPFLTELMPNPASPLTDEDDEYVELYNPNELPYELKGYTLQVGTGTLHDFTFIDSYTIPALGYATFYSRDTKLALANSGGQARLISPDGVVLNESMPYTKAMDGIAWVLEKDVWQWSTTPTPSIANAVTMPVSTKKAATPKSSSAKKAAVKKAAVKKVSAKKVKGAITKKTKAKKEKKPAIATVAQTAEQDTDKPIHTRVLVGVAIAAVLYAAYEYRSDISNRLYQLRQHRAVRRIARSKT